MKKVTREELSPTQQALLKEALAVREMAYAPYSGFKVGAALLDEKNAIHTGCNVEGADFTLTTHAEMGAINAMVKTGVHRLKEIVVVVKSDIGHGMPCGLCRQKIREFAPDPQVPVVGVSLNEQDEIRDISVSYMDELLPFSFGSEHL